MRPHLYATATVLAIAAMLLLPLLTASGIQGSSRISSSKGRGVAPLDEPPVTTGAEYSLVNNTWPAGGVGPGNGTGYPPPLYVWYREAEPQYLGEYPLPGIPGDAVGNGSGPWYPPARLVTMINVEPQYLHQWLLYPREPREAVGNGSGPWYPPIPPVTRLSREPEYLVQWVLPSGPGYGFPVSVSLRLNATRVYVDQPVRVTIRVVSPILSSNPSGLDVYLYMVRRGITGSSLWRLRVVDGWANATITPRHAGNYTVYAVVPRASIYAGARSSNATLIVERYPATLRVAAPRYVFRDEPLRVRVYGENNVTGKGISGETVTVYVRGPTGTVSATTTLTNGEAPVTFTGLPPGTYTVYAELNETRLYSAARSNTVSVRILSVTRELGGTGVSLAEPAAYTAITIATATLLLYITIRRHRRH